MIFRVYVNLPEGKPPFSYGFSYDFPIFLWFFYGVLMIFPRLHVETAMVPAVGFRADKKTLPSASCPVVD